MKQLVISIFAGALLTWSSASIFAHDVNEPFFTDCSVSFNSNTAATSEADKWVAKVSVSSWSIKGHEERFPDGIAFWGATLFLAIDDKEHQVGTGQVIALISEGVAQPQAGNNEFSITMSDAMKDAFGLFPKTRCKIGG
jgi:hypothetical protein